VSSSTSRNFLGIDVSTSCTGFALVDENGKLIEASYVYLSEFPTIHAKAEHVRQELQRYCDRSVSCIAVEECLLGFRRGKSSAQTLITLARFNGVVHYIASSEFGIDPHTINVSTARKQLGIQIAKGENPKVAVAAWMRLQEPDYPWPTKVVKRGKLKGETVLEKGVEDASDAYVMARAALHMNLSSNRIK